MMKEKKTTFHKCVTQSIISQLSTTYKFVGDIFILNWLQFCLHLFTNSCNKENESMLKKKIPKP